MLVLRIIRASDRGGHAIKARFPNFYIFFWPWSFWPSASPHNNPLNYDSTVLGKAKNFNPVLFRFFVIFCRSVSEKRAIKIWGKIENLRFVVHERRAVQNSISAYECFTLDVLFWLALYVKIAFLYFLY